MKKGKRREEDKKDNLKPARNVTRRDFIKYTAGTIAYVSLASMGLGSLSGCGSSGGSQQQIQSYPIDPNVLTTLDRMLSFPIYLYADGNSKKAPRNPDNTGNGLTMSQLQNVSQYAALGYGTWTFGASLPAQTRTDIMTTGYAVPSSNVTTKLLNFFAISDIHITDKEAPNQFIYLQEEDPAFSGTNASIYSPIMMCTTQVLDAAVQTINALHKTTPFDFGISLGDASNNTQYNELRWYIDVIDGKVITPSSGDNLGAGNIDYQMPYQAAGLDKSIPWYQAIGNHDKFYIGSFPVDADPSLGLRQSYIGGTVWNMPDILIPTISTNNYNPANYATTSTFYPVLFNAQNLTAFTPTYYMGAFNGLAPFGQVIDEGPLSQFSSPPTVAADPNRYSLTNAEWIQEFFNTTTNPVGHGFNLVDPAQVSGFACYSFLPKSNIPLKVIVLDDVQSPTDGSYDIHGHGYLDANRWAWLQAELAAGQTANQLMIIAAHIPIGVESIGSEVEWWMNEYDTAAENKNAVDLTELVQTLQNTPNLLMWIAGHRHLNTVKAFNSPDPVNHPEYGFWHVETSSLRDFPQQFRTFEIYLNSDYTVSIVTTNVDPSVADGTPAAKSRGYGIAVQQILQNNLLRNAINAETYSASAATPNIYNASNDSIPVMDLTATGAFASPYPVNMANVTVPTMDPSRLQDNTGDSSIQWVDLSNPPANEVPVPYNASYNAVLLKQLSPTMISALKQQFPVVG
ncbi:MAG: TIGR03768 family metallophosphoesterase [bacterium]